VHTEELHDISSDIIKKDDLEAGHATRVGKRRGACVGLVGKYEGWSPLEDLGVDWMIILKLSFK